jgi:hypothetical protein
MASITREEALATLEDGQAQVEVLVAQLSDEEAARPATMGGGDWSAKDLMGHIARWNEIAIEALGSWREGERPGIEDVWGDGVDKLNAENYGRSKADSPERARSRLRRSHDALVGAIRDMDNAEWHSKAPYQTERRSWLGMMLGSITGAPKRAYGHAFAHLPDLEKYASELRQ